MLVHELKSKIKKLEAARNQRGHETAEHHQTSRDNIAGLQGSSLFALREEYCTKLEKLIE